MPDESKHTELRDSHPIELVKCHSCHSPISSGVERCPYCGQMTTGTERRISKLELDIKRRERLADKRSRHVCKLCNKPVAKTQELCSTCESSDKRKRLMLTTLFAASVILILWFFLAHPI